MNRAYIPSTQNVMAGFVALKDDGNDIEVIRPVLFWEVATPDADFKDLIVNAFVRSPVDGKEVMTVAACCGPDVVFRGLTKKGPNDFT